MGAVSGDINSLGMKCETPADLSSRPVSAMKSGDRAYVVSEEGSSWGPKYFLDQTSTLAPNGTTVIATLSALSSLPISAGRWLSEKAFDASTVDPTVAVNQSATTGLSVQSATAENTIARIGAHETFYNCAVAGAIVGTYPAGGPVNVATQPGHPRTLVVEYTGFDGSDLTVNGFDGSFNNVSEIFPVPAGGTGTVVGVKQFASIGSVTPTNTGSAGQAQILIGESIGVSLSEIGGFFKVSVDGVATTFNSSQPERTFKPFTANPPFDLADKTVEVWYYWNNDQNGHSHDVTDPGHTHVQDPHTHTTS